MTYRADCAISQPKDQGSYRSSKSLGGFGWHPDRGLFIPVAVEDNIELPYATGMNPEQIVDPAQVLSKPSLDFRPVIFATTTSNNSQRIPHE
jgi:hypothetical protein